MKKLGEVSATIESPVTGHESVADHVLPSPQEVSEELDTAATATATAAGEPDVQSELQRETTKSSNAKDDENDAVETPPVETAGSSADKKEHRGANSNGDHAEDDDVHGIDSFEIAQGIATSLEMEEDGERDTSRSSDNNGAAEAAARTDVEDIVATCGNGNDKSSVGTKEDRDGNSNGDHAEDDDVHGGDSFEMAQGIATTHKLEENRERDTGSSDKNRTAEAAAAAATDAEDVAGNCGNGDSNHGSKEVIEVAPETNGMDDQEEEGEEQEGRDQNGGECRERRVVAAETAKDDALLLTNAQGEALKETSHEESSKDTSSSGARIRYLVIPAEAWIAGSGIEERGKFGNGHETEGKGSRRNKEVSSSSSSSSSDVIAVKHDLHMPGSIPTSSSSTVFTVSSAVKTFTDSVTYSKEDGFAGFEEKNTSSSSSSSKKQAPYFKEIEDGAEVAGGGGGGDAFHLHIQQQLKTVHFEEENNTEKKSNNGNNKKNSSCSAEEESEVERVLRLQTTHDLLCPVCGSCITKRVILRKRKRISSSSSALVAVSAENWELPNEDVLVKKRTSSASPTITPVEEEASGGVGPAAAVVHDDGYEEEYEEDWGCLACFTLLFRRVWRHAEILRSSSLSAAEIREPPEDRVSAETIVAAESAAESVDEDGSEPQYYKSNCLPLLFPWRQVVTSSRPELLTPLLSEKEEEKTAALAKDVVQMSTTPTQSSRELPIDALNKAPQLLLPTPAPEQPVNVEHPQNVTAAAAAVRAKDDDINCLSIFLPPFPWGETQETAASNIPAETAATIVEQPALGSDKEVQAIESGSITIGSLDVPLSSLTVLTPTTTLPGEISAAPVDVLPPLATTNVHNDDAGGQGRIEESPRKASVTCLDLCLPAYPWEEALETTRTLEKITTAKQEKEINIPESSASSNATTELKDLLDPNVVFQPVSSASKEVILPVVVLTHPETPTEPAPESLVSSSSSTTQEHLTEKTGIKLSDAFHVTIFVKKIEEEDKITSVQGIDDRASKAGFNCLPLLLPPYPWEEGATQIPVKVDEKALSAKLLREEEQLDSKCLPLKLQTLAWRGGGGAGGGRSGKMTSAAAREEAPSESDVVDDELAEEEAEKEEKPLVRNPPRRREEKREVAAAATTSPTVECPNLPVEQEEKEKKTEAIGIEETTTPAPSGIAVGTTPPAAAAAPAVEEIEECHELPQPVVLVVPVVPVQKLESVVFAAEKETMEAKELADCNCGLLPALLFPPYPWDPSSREFQAETREERAVKWPSLVAERGMETGEVVSRDTRIESRITTTTTTKYTKPADDPTDASAHDDIMHHGDTVDAIKVDTSVSYMDTSIRQHDDQPIQGTFVLNDGDSPPTIVVEPKTLHHFPPISKFLDWDIIPKNRHPPPLQAPPPALTTQQQQQQPPEITEEGEAVAAVSEVSRDLPWTSLHVPPNATTELMNKSSCDCLPIATPSYSLFFRTPRSFDNTEADDQLKEPLISSDAKSNTGSHDSSSSVHVSLHQIHRHEEFKLPLSQMPDGRSVFTDDHEPASCNCWPTFSFSRGRIGGSLLSHKDEVQPLLDKTKADSADADLPTTMHLVASTSDVLDETMTSVIVTTDASVIEVHGSDAHTTLEAATVAAEDLGMMAMTSAVSTLQEYLKSVVYGGLDVSLISLGVVASAAGGDAKTRTVLAMGLANLIFGAISFFHKVTDLYKESPAQFRETVGHSFLLNGCLAFLSFLVFGSLPSLTFGFSFRQSNNHDYKMLATVVVSVISVVLLGCAKVFAKVTQQSYFTTLSALIMTGVVAAVAGFYTGEYFSKLLAQFGFDT